MSADGSPAPWWGDLGERLQRPTRSEPAGLRARADEREGFAVAETASCAERAPVEDPPPRRGLGGGSGPETLALVPLPELPDAAWIAALMLLDAMGPVRLGNLLTAFGPAGAWARVLDGSLASRRDLGGQLHGMHWPALVGDWQRTARTVDVVQFWDRHVRAGVGVAVRGSPAFPSCLADDPEPPAALFHLGDPGVIPGPRVAVVGTRRCSARGRRFAEAMGFELSRAGVRVVSGLARGIDGAAHVGALRAAERGGAPPIGVVASGLDVVYPHDHAGLWAAVASTGVLLSEVPLTVRPNRWRFPARNRVIAGLADRVVVVESPVTGGSMYTVEEALRRGVDVLAVPGAVGLRAGEGTNKLIFDGAGVARDADDVLLDLGIDPGPTPSTRLADPRPTPGEAAVKVLDAMAWQPVTLASLVARSGCSLDEVAEAVAELQAGGWVEQCGAWLERVAR